MLTRKEEQELIQKENTDPIKTRSFRLAESTIAKFQEITEQLGCENQGQAMEALIAAYKGQHEKETLKDPNRLDEFEKYESALRDMFLNLLREKEDAVLLAKKDVSAQMESKDNIIIELQNKLSALEKSKEEAEKVLEPLKKENIQLKEDLEEVKDEKENVIKATKATLNQLTDDNNSLKRELDELRKDAREKESLYQKRVEESLRLQKELDKTNADIGPYKENISRVTSENRILDAENKRLREENASLKTDMESLKNSHAAEIKLAASQAELKAREEMRQQIEVIRKELDQAKDKYILLLEGRKVDKK